MWTLTSTCTARLKVQVQQLSSGTHDTAIITIQTNCIMSVASASVPPSSSSRASSASFVEPGPGTSKGQSVSIETTIELDGWWGNNSALVKRGSILHRIKRRLQYQLSSQHGLTNPDRQNEVVHIALIVDGWPNRDEIYNKVNGAKLVLNKNSFELHPHWCSISIPVQVASVTDLHMTCFFLKGRKRDHGSLFPDLFENVLKSIVEHKDLPEDHRPCPHEDVIYAKRAANTAVGSSQSDLNSATSATKPAYGSRRRERRDGGKDESHSPNLESELVLDYDSRFQQLHAQLEQVLANQGLILQAVQQLQSQK